MEAAGVEPASLGAPRAALTEIETAAPPPIMLPSRSVYALRRAGSRIPPRAATALSWLLLIVCAPLVGFGLMVTGLMWLGRKVLRRPEKAADWWHPRMNDPGGS